MKNETDYWCIIILDISTSQIYKKCCGVLYFYTYLERAFIMIKYVNSLNIIKQYLVDLERFVHIENANGEYSINKLSENLLIGFFNILFDANFENANYTLALNYPGIDIVDFNNKVALQITSENSSGKILETVKMILEYKIYKEINTFYIYILDRKKIYQNLQKRIDKITGNQFKFNAINIYDAASAYVYLNHLGDKNKIEAIRQYLEERFGRYNQSFSDYPEYLTDISDGIVPSFTGRTQLIHEITGLLESGTSIFLSSVGGLGKTEVARSIMKQYTNMPTTESGIYYLGWVRYDNNDLRTCIKSAFHLKGTADEAWIDFCNMAQKKREKMLVVIDNIESLHGDEYLNKLSNLPCRLLVTGRCRTLSSLKVVELPPLNMEECRKIFYYYYHFKENNAILNDIIGFTCRLTIMVEFLAKVAQLEEFSLQDLYGKLVEMGFKLSQEDVSGNHEKLRGDHTIIEQMCLLFSLCAINEKDQKILTWISIIPSIPFTRKNAGNWFGIQKNSTLMRLFNQGLLEIEHSNTIQKYWMHSVIAAAIREQKKDILYEETRPFIERLSEELDFGSQWGQGYKKEYLIPFSWSVSDILEDHWNSESDVGFLTRLYYVTFESGNYAICRKLIEQIFRIDMSYETIHPAYLIRDYKNQADLYMKIERFPDALDSLDKAREQLEILESNTENNESFPCPHDEVLDENIESYCKYEYSLLMHKFGIAYHLKGDFEEALSYYYEAYNNDLQIENVSDRELATCLSSITTVLRDMGLFEEAYQEIEKAIQYDQDREMDTEIAMNYDIYASICAELAADGMPGFYEKADKAFSKVISFREKHMGKYHPDLGDGYHEYSLFLYYNNELDKAEKYTKKALDISSYNFTENSISYARNLNTMGIILDARGKGESAIDVYRQVLSIYDSIQNVPEDDKASTYYNIAAAYQQLEEFEKSLNYYKKAEDICRKTLSKNSVRFMEIHQCRGECLMMSGQYKEAVAEYTQALGLLHSQIWPRIEMTSDIAECYLMSGDLPNAKLNFIQVLKCLEEWEETEAGMQINILLNLCEIEKHLGNLMESEDYYQRAFQDAQQSKDPELISIVSTYKIQ